MLWDIVPSPDAFGNEKFFIAHITSSFREEQKAELCHRLSFLTMEHVWEVVREIHFS